MHLAAPAEHMCAASSGTLYGLGLQRKWPFAMTMVSVESALCLVDLLAGGPRCQDGLDPDRHQAASVAATPEVSKNLAVMALSWQRVGKIGHLSVSRIAAVVAGHEGQVFLHRHQCAGPAG